MEVKNTTERWTLAFGGSVIMDNGVISSISLQEVCDGLNAVEKLEAEKKELIEFVKFRIADSFRCLENGVWEHYPFDSHTREGIIGMKDGYSDILKEIIKQTK